MTVAIFCPGQNGDALTCTSVLKYKKELWGPDVKIVWFISDENRDLLKYNEDIDEIRHFAHGWQISEHDKNTIYKERIAKDKADGREEWGDWSLLRTSDNKMNTELKHMFPILADIDLGFFPAPWMVPGDRKFATTYPNCSKRIFGVSDHYEYHPVLYHSLEEKLAALEFMSKLPQGLRTIIIESYCGSGQSKITHDMIKDTMFTCEDAWGPCNFIFVSHKYLNNQETFSENFFNERVISAAHFTVRQCALLANYAKLFISTSSGVTVASSCWGNRPVPIIQYCGSSVCGTKELALGECVQIFTDDNPNSQIEYKKELINLLTKYK